jgi:hypothetical protein
VLKPSRISKPLLFWMLAVAILIAFADRLPDPPALAPHPSKGVESSARNHSSGPTLVDDFLKCLAALLIAGLKTLERNATVSHEPFFSLQLYYWPLASDSSPPLSLS